MCVIIDRKPGVEIPQSKIETACDINKHGFGFVFLEKGRLKIVRSLSDNDPKEVAKLLNDHKDQRVWLHLRHATVGKVSQDNSHPMVALDFKQDGQDVVFMHNGTLYEYKRQTAEDLSDTFFYNEEFIKPLAKRCRAFGGDVLHDEFFKRQVSKSLVGSQSVLVFLDSTGYVLRGNGDKGKEFEWGWASNDYSFNDNHHRSSTWNFSTYMDGELHNDPLPWDRRGKKRKGKNKSREEVWNEWEKEFNTVDPELAASIEDTKQATANINLKHGMKAINTKLKEEWKVTEKSLSNDIRAAASINPIPRKTFCELADIKHISEVERLSREDFIDLCQNHPVAMAELFIDLAAEGRRNSAIIAIQRQANEKKAKNATA